MPRFVNFFIYLMGVSGWFLKAVADADCFRAPVRLRAIAAVVSAAFVVSSCMPWEENKLIEQGIGTDLHSPDVAEQTRLSEQYLRFMCVEAGIARLSPEGDPQCNVNELSPRHLTVLVRAGFNDIDRRCDSYLAWLNSKRRSNAAINNQLNQVGTATAALMSIAGASRDPISLAAVAFGLAADSFNNFYSRLLLEVESSTVELIVSKNRQEFRKDLNNTMVHFRPDAMHILRSYLLICTPHVIENNINIRSRFSVSGNIAAPQDSFGTDVSRSTLSRSGLVRRAAPVRARQQVNRGRFRPKPPKGISERTQLDVQSLKRVQLTLCVPESGQFDVRTKQGLRIWETVALGDRQQSGLVRNSKLEGAEADILKTEPACGKDLRNFQERDLFQNNIESRTLARLKTLMQDKAAQLSQSGNAVQLSLPETISSLDQLRPGIAQLKNAMGIAEKSADKTYLNEEITPVFLKSL